VILFIVTSLSLSSLGMREIDTNKPKDDSSEIDTLARKSRAILNKLTPTNISKLAMQFMDFELDTNEKMQACVDIIHEIAIDETTNMVTYARLCEALKYKGMKVTGTKVETTNLPSFRRFLAFTCQREFQKDYMDASKNEEKELIARKRSLGNIRFIGELFKLKLLTVRIIHECIKQLLGRRETETRVEWEEQLECVCKLIKTVGKLFEEETKKLLENVDKTKSQGIRNLDIYFADIRSLISKRDISPRIRFMLQDLVDLRQNKWVCQREDVVAQTLDSLHDEIQRERELEKLMSLNTI